MLNPENEAIAAALEATGDYRVLRRLVRHEKFGDERGEEIKHGIMLDVETTGLDATKDEIIWLGMVAFAFTPSGRIIRIEETISSPRDPGFPIPPAITALTGIDDDVVRGRVIDSGEVEAAVRSTHLVIAHNAEFDRPFAENLFPIFATHAWACSQSQIDWASEGFEGARLSYLAQQSGFFFDAHRAEDDCLATIELLARPLPKSGVPALAKLLERARRRDIRIWATNSPFATKDTLKARGYRWNDGADGRPKAWNIDVAEADADAEVAWLHKEIYGRFVNLRTDRITAFNRFKGAHDNG